MLPLHHNGTYLLCCAARTNHVLRVSVHREPQRLAFHSKAHRQHEMNEVSQKDNTAAGAKGEAPMHNGGGIAPDRKL